jgi:hypothetical protein
MFMRAPREPALTEQLGQAAVDHHHATFIDDDAVNELADGRHDGERQLHRPRS